ncbi:hypothetical protein [uncultured Kordia sp.]|uniref:hypothetical protein n=1 Tax=uncultured Kordia sp. TaxID=507699 RepID=UPI00262A20D5|nr:hypothetical protein [uncultured Kordia sp.]
MKKILILAITLITVGTQIVLGQTREQQRRAETYYQNQQKQEQLSKSWDWLFGSSNPNYNQNNLVKWENNNGDWYVGKGKNKERNGLGIDYSRENNGIFFSQFINNKANGFTFYSNKNGYSFFGSFKLGKKNGFVISKWSKTNPASFNGYSNIIKYLGEYKEGEWHGYGIVYFKDGTYKSGVWIENVLSKELPKLEVLEALGF